MKAIRVHEPGSPEVMRLEEVPDPRPSAGQVMVRLYCAGVNPVDTYIRAGNYPNLSYPYTPGLDGAGIVESVGAGASGVAPGDRVFVHAASTYAEKTVCADTEVFLLPPQLTFQQGACIGVPFATAHRALFFRAHAVAGETVLVHGASGGVGTAAVQIARAAGLTVIGTAGTSDGLRLVKLQGADHALEHGAPSTMDQIRSLTGGRGVDVVLEMAAHVNLGQDLGILAPGGRVVVIGSRGSVEINPRDLMARDAAVLGILLFNAPEKEILSSYAAIQAGLATGVLKPVVGQEMPLADAPLAHEAILRSGAHGNIILRVRD